MQEGGAEAPHRFALVAIAASAGGLTAIATVLGALPHNFDVPVVVVQHVDPNHRSLVPEILGRRTALAVQAARTGVRPRPGVVYVAPAGRHTVIAPDGTVELVNDEPIHYLKPSADRLFRTVAAVCGAAIGVVLTGTGSDGADGIVAIKRAGGLAIAQDEASSAFFGMPQAAIQTGQVDFILPLDQIAAKLIALAGVSHE